MAKAKKSETIGSASGSETPKRKAPARKSTKSAKPAAPQAPPGVPLIDTSLAAQTAAKLLAAGLNKPSGNVNAENAPKQESALFKQIKAGLNKPHATTMSNLLEKSHGPDPSRTHQGFNKQIGHNQTFGADVTRSGVPRRTPG
jgi:hypothetical protein